MAKVKLTENEFNIVSRLMHCLKVDSYLAITEDRYGNDVMFDFDDNCTMSLKDGLEIVYEAIAYPLIHEGLSRSEGGIMVNLFARLGVTEKNKAAWLLK